MSRSRGWQQTGWTKSQFPAVVGGEEQVGRKVNFPQSLVATNRGDDRSIHRSLSRQPTGLTKGQFPAVFAVKEHVG